LKPTEQKYFQRGFSLTELLVVLIVASMAVAGIYSFVNKTRRSGTTQRMRANIESMTQISFFIIGRDIRRAGSNPTGIIGYGAGVPIPLSIADTNAIEIKADLNADGDTNDDEETVKYEFIDDPDNPDGTPDQIRRQAGNQLVIENVKAFDLRYVMASGNVESPASDPALVRRVRLHLVAGTGRIDPNTGREDTKEVQTDIMLRNFR